MFSALPDPREYILSRSGSSGNTGGPSVPEDMSEYYLHSKERAFSLCGQIVASLILSVSNVRLYSPLGRGGEGGPRGERLGGWRTRITELGKTSIFA
jgi:hypothetical protein